MTAAKTSLRLFRPFVVSPIDRNRGDMAIMCPQQYRLLGLRALFGRGFQPASRAWWEEFQRDFFRWGEWMRYTPWGAFETSERHRWGQLVLWPKEKTMRVKSWL